MDGVKTILISLRDSEDTDDKGHEVQLANITEALDRYPEFKDYQRVVRSFFQPAFEPEYLKDRPDLLFLLEKLEKGDIVAFDTIDRMSRNEFVSADFRRELLHKGIDRIFFTKGMLDIRNRTQACSESGKAHDDSTALFNKLKGAKARWRKEGSYVGGRVHYGYNAVRDGLRHRGGGLTRYKENQDKVAYYKLIQELYRTYRSTTDVAIKMNERGIPSPLGRQWRSITVARILRDRFYLGKKGQDGSWVIPPLTDESTYNDLQAILNENRKRFTGPEPTHMIMMRGMIKCRRCQTRVRPLSDFRREHWRYYCGHRFLNKEARIEVGGNIKHCDLPSLRCDKLHEFVWDIVREIVKNPNKLRENLKITQDTGFVDKIEFEVAVSEKEKQLRRLDEVQRKLLDLYLDPEEKIEKKEFDKRKTLLDAQQSGIAEDIRKMKVIFAKKEDQTVKLKQLEDNIEAIRAAIDDFTEAEKRTFLQLIELEAEIDYSEQGGWQVGISGMLDMFAEKGLTVPEALCSNHPSLSTTTKAGCTRIS